MSGDPVNNPSHYTWIEGVECLDVVENFNFNTGNAIKYIFRHDHKGKPLEDLKKARFYIDREIDRLERTRGTTEPREVWIDTSEYRGCGGGRVLRSDTGEPV